MGGNVVGITVGKLDLLRIQKKEGFLPEDVNFAIHVNRIPAEANIKLDPYTKNIAQISIKNLYKKNWAKLSWWQPISKSNCNHQSLNLHYQYQL